MPYFPTSQEYLTQSALLLEAYPHDTRITTKYSHPKKSTIAKSRSRSKLRSSTTADTPTTEDPQSTQQQPPPATLTLKTYNPTTGICLKYRTDKGAEIGRLIAALGKLASGAPVTETAVTAAGGTGTPTVGDVDMTDVPARAATPVTETVNTTKAAKGGNAGGGGAGGSGKGKKKGKGKR